MPTLNDTVAAFVAAREYDQATLSRLGFWSDQFADRELTEITPDDVDAALVRLAERGRLRPARNRETVKAGQPLKPSTLNRYISQLGSVYKYARRYRLIPRTFVFPTANIEKAPEPADPERYFRPEEIDRLRAHVDAARALLDGGGTVGRKLDFLMQEFNREANTLCSKAQSSDLTAIGLDLKAVIDQMREQVQNIE